MLTVQQTLQSLGLNTKECQVYLALLAAGASPASLLGRRTGITRSTAQYICQQLVRKKLATRIERNNTFIYTCEPPEKLLYLLQHEQEEIKEKADQVNRIIGVLKRMVNPNTTLPKVQFYEGQEGLIDLYERMLDMRRPIDSFEEEGALTELFHEYALEFVRKRVERKIPNRCIAPTGSPYNVSDPKKFIEVRLIDAKQFPFSCHIKICGDLVGIFSFEKDSPVGIGIWHRNIADNFRLLFDQLWQTLEAIPSSSMKDAEQKVRRDKRRSA